MESTINIQVISPFKDINDCHDIMKIEGVWNDVSATIVSLTVAWMFCEILLAGLERAKITTRVAKNLLG